MKQFLKLPYKFPDLNEYQNACRSHWSKGAALKKEWTEIVAWEAKARKIKPVDGEAFISFTWIEKTRRRDKDNIAFAKKFILDGLVEAGILKGDGWKGINGFSDEFYIGEADEVLVEMAEKD